MLKTAAFLSFILKNIMETINAAVGNMTGESITPVTLVINEAVEKGFDLIFKLKEDGSLWDQHGIYYAPEQMAIAYSRVFKDTSDSTEQFPATTTSTIYLLRNDEGDKGILVDAPGIYEDSRMDSFIRSINRVHQPVTALRPKPGPSKKLVWAAAGLLLVTSALSLKLISRMK